MCYSFLTNDEKSWVRINFAVIPQCVEILFFAQSLRCLKICMVNPSMTFIFSWLGNMLHSDTPLIVAIITEGCRIMEKSTVSHSQDFVDFHSAATQIFTECFFSVHISQHNGNYKMIAFYWYVLCIGILLSWHANDVMFWGVKPILGRKRITLPEPKTNFDGTE